MELGQKYVTSLLKGIFLASVTLSIDRTYSWIWYRFLYEI